MLRFSGSQRNYAQNTATTSLIRRNRLRSASRSILSAIRTIRARCRMARIGRLNVPKEMNGGHGYDGDIGLDTYAVMGDSGSPVFNMKGRVIGVMQAVAGTMGYFKPIKHFIETGNIEAGK